MAVHNDLGREGERLAEEFLLSKGFSILHRNWRYSHYEIDIIALKNDIPHFVEVKLRSSNKFGFPEENVSRKKIRFLLQAINEYLFQHPCYRNFRLNILSITTNPDATPEFFLIEDVYL